MTPCKTWSNPKAASSSLALDTVPNLFLVFFFSGSAIPVGFLNAPRPNVICETITINPVLSISRDRVRAESLILQPVLSIRVHFFRHAGLPKLGEWS